MLHILLLILKIIGIVLLCILGILLFGIACALFVPVCYRIEAVRKEGEGQPPAAVRVKVTWLLHLINFLICFDGELLVRARALLFTVLRIPQKEKRRKKAKKEKNGKEKSIQKKQEKAGEPKRGAADKTAAAMPRTENTAEREDDVSKAREDAAETGQTQESGIAGKADTTKPAGTSQERRAKEHEITQTLPEGKNEGFTDDEDTQGKPGLWDKLRAIPKILQSLFEKIRRFFENIEYTINRFCDKIRSVSETIAYYREIVEGEAFKRSFALCQGELLSIVKRLKPRKFEASLVVGMEDPASTGEILAICGMLYPLIGGHVDVRGDFEKKRLEGQILIVGKLRMFTFLRTALRIYFNKDIRKLYRLLKRRQ